MWPFPTRLNLTAEESAELQAQKVLWMGWVLLVLWLLMIIFTTRVGWAF